MLWHICRNDVARRVRYAGLVLESLRPLRHADATLDSHRQREIAVENDASAFRRGVRQVWLQLLREGREPHDDFALEVPATHIIFLALAVSAADVFVRAIEP